MSTRNSPDAPSQRSPAGLFSGPNLPFTLILIAAVAGLGAYLYAGGRGPAPPPPGSASTVAEVVAGGEQGLPTTVPSATTAAGTDPATTAGDSPVGPLVGMAAVEVASGFTAPVFAVAPPGDGRIFVLERAGPIRVVDPEGRVLPDPFLDLNHAIDSSSGFELGLLGLAFHPAFAENGRFFVHFTDLNADSVLAEFTVGSDPNRADPDSERVVLFVSQAGLRHRGGMIQFGPDGYLYLALGDGTGMNVNPQNLDTLQGSILRIDVDGGVPYAIPPDNPFASGGGRGEIWAYGLRNPWRFSIDAEERRIYIGDVGEDTWEEINSVPLAVSGMNFGWPLMEGSTCYTDAACGSRTDLVRPILEYGHQGGQCAVTGGYVYRGAAMPELAGHYFYADWCAGWVRSFLFDGENVTRPADWAESLGDGLGRIASFGVDGSREILLVTSDTGRLYRLVPQR